MCGAPARMYCWDDHFSVVSCVACLRKMYDESFCYSPFYGGQMVSQGVAEHMTYASRFISDADAGVLAFLLSFWSSLPEATGR